jgi:hypothetical protein
MESVSGTKRKHEATETQSPLAANIEGPERLEPSLDAPDISTHPEIISWSLDGSWEQAKWCGRVNDTVLEITRHLTLNDEEDAKLDILQAWAIENEKETIPTLTDETIEEYRQQEKDLTCSFSKMLGGSTNTHVSKYAIRVSKSSEWLLVEPFSLTRDEKNQLIEAGPTANVLLRHVTGKLNGSVIRITESADNCTINGQRYQIDGTNKVRAWQVKVRARGNDQQGITILAFKVPTKNARLKSLATLLTSNDLVTTEKIVSASREARFRKLQGIGRAACERQVQQINEGKLGPGASKVEIVAASPGLGLPVIDPRDYTLLGEKSDTSRAPVSVETVLGNTETLSENDMQPE